MASVNHDATIIHVRLRICSTTLQTIVATLKQMAGCDENGRYRVDTAEGVNALIDRFLVEKDFDAFACDPSNYVDIEP